MASEEFYQSEKQEDFTAYDVYFTNRIQTLVTVSSLVTAIFGLTTNTFVLGFFLKIVETSKIQSALWANISVSYLVKCLVMIFIVMGDLFDSLSDEEQECRYRYALPVSVDIVCISNLIMLMLERDLALYCHLFYSLLPKLKSVILFFGWSYGSCYLLFVVLGIQDYEAPIRCATPYIHVRFIDPVQLLSFVAAVVLNICSLISTVYMYLNVDSSFNKRSPELEKRSTYLVTAFGTTLLVFWIPRQTNTILFWFRNINHVKYSVNMKLYSLFLDLTVVLPFLSLLFIYEFRTALKYFLSFAPFVPVTTRKKAKDNYKKTLRTLTEHEKRLSTSTPQCQICSAIRRVKTLTFKESSAEENIFDVTKQQMPA